MMKHEFDVFISIAAGILITVVSGYATTFIQPVGLILHGYPLYWRAEGTFGIGTNRVPINEINWTNLIVDAVLWSALILVILLIFDKLERKNK